MTKHSMCSILYIVVAQFSRCRDNASLASKHSWLSQTHTLYPELLCHSERLIDNVARENTRTRLGKCNLTVYCHGFASRQFKGYLVGTHSGNMMASALFSSL